MNRIKQFIQDGRKVFGTLLLTITVTFALLPVGAQAQADIKGPNLFQGITGLSPSVATVVRSNQLPASILANAVAIRPGYGLAFTAAFTPASSSTTNVTFEIALSYDGTNFCTDTPLNAVFMCKGTPAIRAGTNWSAALVEGARYASLTAVTNGTAVTVTLGSAGLSVVK